MPVAFGIEPDDLPAWRARFEAAGLELSHVVWEGSGESLYFRYPDGHLIEPLTDVGGPLEPLHRGAPGA